MRNLAVDEFLGIALGIEKASARGFDGVFYNKEVFGVDGVVIARVVRDVDGELLLLTGKNDLSPKISEYGPALRSQDKIKKQIMVEYGRGKSVWNHGFTSEGMYAAYSELLEKLAGDYGTNYKANQFLGVYRVFKELKERVFTDWEDRWSEAAATVKKWLCDLKDITADYIASHSYRELVDIAFFDGDVVDLPAGISKEQFLLLLRAAMVQGDDVRYLKFIDGAFYTPDKDADGNYRRVMSYTDGRKCIDLVLSGDIRHGMKFGDYTCMKQTPEWIQLSCNRYSRELFDVLADEVSEWEDQIK